MLTRDPSWPPGEGYAGVLVAPGMDQALDLAARTAPDVVVLDVMLPDLDGFEVLRRLRAADRHALSVAATRGSIRSGTKVPVVYLVADDGRGGVVVY